MHGTHTKITRIFSFDAGHRILGHETKCKHLHGHTYVAHVEISASTLDELGRIVDFGCLKDIIGGWIDKNWDHNMILNCNDPLIKMFSTAAGFDLEMVKDELARKQALSAEVFGNRTPYLMPCNPTAENMARELGAWTAPLLPEPIYLTKITLYETQKCYAEVSFAPSFTR